MTANPVTTKMATPRFKTIDSLRGIAAMGVVFFHLSGHLQAELSWLPDPIFWVLRQGFLGVPIFFVLSGFVICQSVGENRVTGSYLANFAWRRSLRLDPPYWVAMALALVLLWAKGRFLGFETEFPTLGNIGAHIVYLQDLLRFPPVISSVYWTLCLEVQLYMFFIVSLWLAQILGRRLGRSPYPIHLLIVLTLGIYSLLLNHGILSIGIPGTFLPYWHYFLMGVLVNLAIRHKPRAGILFPLWIIAGLVVQSTHPILSYAVAGMSTSVFIYWVGMRDRLTTVLDNRLLGYLGRISYSLYLIHPDVGWKAISVAKKFLGQSTSPPVSILLFAIGLVVSVIVSHGLHKYVERPTMRFSARFKRSAAFPASHHQYQGLSSQ